MADNSIDLSELKYVVEGLEEAEQTLTGMADFRSGTFVLHVGVGKDGNPSHVVHAVYKDNQWSVSIEPFEKPKPRKKPGPKPGSTRKTRTTTVTPAAAEALATSKPRKV